MLFNTNRLLIHYPDIKPPYIHELFAHKLPFIILHTYIYFTVDYKDAYGTLLNSCVANIKSANN